MQTRVFKFERNLYEKKIAGSTNIAKKQCRKQSNLDNASTQNSCNSNRYAFGIGCCSHR